MRKKLPLPTDSHATFGTATKLRERVNAQAQFETEFEDMERRLREDESRVKRQRRIVYVLRERGADSMLAEELLHAFEDLLTQRRLLAAGLKARSNGLYARP